jgi:LemA protein
MASGLFPAAESVNEAPPGGDIHQRLTLTARIIALSNGHGQAGGRKPLAAFASNSLLLERSARQTCGRIEPMSASTLIVLAVIVVVILWAITAYNNLVSMRQRVNEAFADVDVQLRQRHDLIPNLVETVKGYAAHERGTLDEVVKARNAAVAAQGTAQQAAAENMLSGALRQLFALAESYPDLKASANFQQLQAELTDIENKIAAARRFFNNAVQEYNTGIQRFPAALFASAFGFAPKEFFDLGDERKTVGEAPQVKF